MAPPTPRPRVLRALEQFAPMLDPRSCDVEPLGRGVQAETYSIRPRGRWPAPAAGPDLVFKLYRPAAPAPDLVAADEFESLGRLNAALDGRVIAGWGIRTPVPLLRGDRPHGLIMTRVPGRSINSYLGEAGARADVLASLAEAVVASLATYWRESGRIYGDIDFNNILCDPESRTLAFIDPGMPGADYLCEGVARDWFPASRDLAYLLFEVAVSVRLYLGNRAARGRQAGLVEAIVSSFAGGVGPGARRAGLLDEIQACTRVHLGRVRAGWSPAGLWRLLVRRHAARSLGRTIGRLKSAAAGGPRGGAAGRPAVDGEAACTLDRSR